MDEELSLLLRDEVDRRLQEAMDAPTLEGSRRVAHALKGTFAMAGARELSASFGRLERRLTQQDADAITDLHRLLTMAQHLLREGKNLPESTWPEPPHDLLPSQIQADAMQSYIDAVIDRVARIDAALSGAFTPEEKVREVFREVHTIKGAALATGDEAMAWFCHGFEELLRAATKTGSCDRVLDDIETHRGILAALATDPLQALSLLRGRSSIPSPPSRLPDAPLPLPPKRPTVDARESEGRSLADATVRVPSAVIDSLFERSLQLGLLRPRLTGAAEDLDERRAELSHAVSNLREATRLIGPPRPWGAPARAIDLLRRVTHNLTPLMDGLGEVTTDVRQVAKRVAEDTGAFTRSVHELRATEVQTLFDRVAASATTEAKHLEKLISIVQSGAEVKLDRSLVEGLVEPLRQLVRNSIVHGIEPVADRLRAGKPPAGRLTLSASVEGGFVTLTVEDDGRGVDASALRDRAVALGLAPRHIVDRLTDTGTLEFLFVPGFSTHRSPGLMAGRGVGLDLTHAAVERLGGVIQLATTQGEGLITTLSFPTEGSLVRVLWVRSAGVWFAIPVLSAVRVIARADLTQEPLQLGTLLGRAGAAGNSLSSFAISLPARISGELPVFLGVDAIGTIEDVVVRPMPPLARAAGPFAAVIAFGDELRLVLDPLRLRRLANLRRSESPDSVLGP